MHSRRACADIHAESVSLRGTRIRSTIKHTTLKEGGGQSWQQCASLHVSRKEISTSPEPNSPDDSMVFYEECFKSQGQTSRKDTKTCMTV